MSHWTPIRYRGFYDVPRIFLAEYQDQLVLFSCPFNDELDEYPDVYKVYLMPSLTEKDLEGSWEELFLKSKRYLGEAPVKDVRFDPSRRREVGTAVIETLMCTPAGKKA